MFAHEVHSGEVKTAAAGGATAGLEDSRLCGERIDFGAFGGGFGAVRFD